MEEIKVGDYVRDSGEILKIEIFEKLPYYNNDRVLVKFKEYAGSNTYFLKEIEEWKHSSNIMDLIEVGDYVNGEEVTSIYDENKEDEIIQLEFNNCGNYIYFTNNDVKNIVTHEQFNSIKYEVI